MKITIYSNEIKRIVALSCKNILSRNVMPIMEDIKFTMDGDQLVLTSANEEQEICLTVQPNRIDGTFFPFCMNGKILLDVLSQIPSDDIIQMDVNDKTHILKIVHSKGFFSKNTDMADDFPVYAVDRGETTEAGILTKDAVPSLLNATKYVSTEKGKTIVNSVLLDLKNDSYVIVSADGQMMYKYCVECGTPFIIGSPRSVLLSVRTVNLLAAVAVTSERITVSATDTHVVFTGDNFLLKARLTDGKYPKYDLLIPKNFVYDIEFDRQELISAVKRVIICGGIFKCTTFSCTDGVMKIRGKNMEYGMDAEETIEYDGNADDRFIFSVNGDRLLQELNTLSSDVIKMYVIGETKAIVLKEKDAYSQITLLIMPIVLPREQAYR